MSVCHHTSHFSPEPTSLDDTFSISIESLIKAATINQTPQNSSFSRVVKQATTLKFSRTHKRSKSSNSRIHYNKSKIVGKGCEITNNSRENLKSSKMNAVPRQTKLATNDNFYQPKILSYYPPRLLTLFLLGSFTSFVIDHLLTQNNITEYPKDITKLIDTAAWIPPICGASAVLVGSLFSLADYWFMRKPQEFQREWSNVMRCMGGFIGVAYAATKLPWSSNYQVSCTLALISIVLWFLFDRTLHGFMMSALFSSIGTGVMYMLVSNGIYRYEV
ncbi:6152_t:CDS:2 [Funneliformis geosporum]|nr:6152_t:CDS:2 [Funneliformis geosporum]